jgi:hypothetical protein
MNAITINKAAERAQAEAPERLHQVADATLHELVDEYVALTKVIADGTTSKADGYGNEFSDEAKVAIQNRGIVNGAARARFGIEFSEHDACF